MSSVFPSESRNGVESTKAGIESLLRSPTSRLPRLLVSVRSSDEARRAIDGGAEILDVKEPRHGSLGMANLAEIVQISHLGDVVSGEIPLSIALGEVTDWSVMAQIPPLPDRITFAKLGLSQCRDRDNWKADWLRVRTEFEQRSASTLNWVAVAYADSIEAASPAIDSVLEAGIETCCAGLLIDTWSKSGITLLDQLDVERMAAIAARCHSAGLFLALAGRIQRNSLPQLARIPANVLAIRSAACRGAERTSELDSGCVSEFRREMRRLTE